MPRLDFDKHRPFIQLGVSIANMLLLAGGLLWAAATFTSGSDRDLKEAHRHIAQLQVEVADLRKTQSNNVALIRDGQEKTSNRLTALETQTTFILSTLNRLESLLRNGSQRL